jgi:hypothetical protein
MSRTGLKVSAGLLHSIVRRWSPLISQVRHLLLMEASNERSSVYRSHLALACWSAWPRWDDRVRVKALTGSRFPFFSPEQSVDISQSIATISLCRCSRCAIISLGESDHSRPGRRERSRRPSAGGPRAGGSGLHRYAMTGQGDVKALQGRDGYRLRIGSYRVIFDEDATTILAIYIGRRTTTTYRGS